MRCLVLAVAAPFALGCAHHPPQAAEAHPHGEMHHRFEHAEEWAARFEDPSRDAWQKPDDVIATLALKPDAVVADLGAATGYFSVRLARALPKGKVYGVDVERSMVDYLTARAAKEGLANLTPVLGTFDEPKLPEPVDLVLVVDTYHHISARPAYFTRLAARLKPGGRLAVVDFRLGAKRGPPDEHKLAPDVVTRELAEAGFRPAGSYEFLADQYFLVFERP